MSVSPAQNSAKPSPVPGPSTVASDAGAAVLEQLADASRDGLDGRGAGDDHVAFGVGAVAGCRRRSTVVVGASELVVVVGAARRGHEAEGEQQGKPERSASS